jgi:hypothetical protein
MRGKEEVMQPKIKKHGVWAGAMLALWLAAATAAQACLWGDGPEDRGRAATNAPSAFRVFPEAHHRGFGVRPMHHAPAPGPGFPGRPAPFRLPAEGFFSPREACAPGGGFFGLLGAGWSEALKGLDLDRWLGQTRDDPVLILFGGLVRPKFAALIFRLDAGSGPMPPNSPPHPTPLPASALLLGAGLAGLRALRAGQRRRPPVA